MEVTLIGKTDVWRGELGELSGGAAWPPIVGEAETLTEFAGRACYQSWGRPNPATASNYDYLDNILKQQHYSVLEHASFTVYIKDVSRSLTHELVRHRHLSFSQLSQRFVKLDVETAPVYPPLFTDMGSAQGIITSVWIKAVDAYWKLLNFAETEGATRKQAAEAARCVLPNCTPTELVVTGNHRAWREMVLKRMTPGADAEIREFAGLILGIGKNIAPGLWQDLTETEEGHVAEVIA